MLPEPFRRNLMVNAIQEVFEYRRGDAGFDPPDDDISGKSDSGNELTPSLDGLALPMRVAIPIRPKIVRADL